MTFNITATEAAAILRTDARMRQWMSEVAAAIGVGGLTPIGAAAGPIGDATHVAQVTIDIYGRVTALASVAIAFPAAANYWKVASSTFQIDTAAAPAFNILDISNTDVNNVEQIRAGQVSGALSRIVINNTPIAPGGTMFADAVFDSNGTTGASVMSLNAQGSVGSGVMEVDGGAGSGRGYFSVTDGSHAAELRVESGFSTALTEITLSAVQVIFKGMTATPAPNDITGHGDFGLHVDPTTGATYFIVTARDNANNIRSGSLPLNGGAPALISNDYRNEFLLMGA